MKNKSTSSNKKEAHIPIMVDAVLKGFEGVEISVFYEGTVGAGGHAAQILEAHPEIKRYIGCDKDPESLSLAEKTLSRWKNKVELIQGNFADLDEHLNQRGIEKVEGFFLT